MYIKPQPLYTRTLPLVFSLVEFSRLLPIPQDLGYTIQFLSLGLCMNL